MVKILEERDCCETRDLLPYRGSFDVGAAYDGQVRFCRHCGQLWTANKQGVRREVYPGDCAPMRLDDSDLTKALGA